MDPSRQSAPSERRIPTSCRLFVGIVLSDAARATCAAAIETLRRAGFAARFEEPEKLHVTLAFLGNVAPSRVEEIAAAMGAAASQCAPVTVTLDKTGAFPHERTPRVVYVGAREQGAGFRNLSAQVRAAYVKLGFLFKEDAVAHVTIARVKDSRRPLPLIEIPATPLEVDALTLFESVFDKEKNTSRYVESARCSLKTPPS